jgi:hypothetical protein
MLEVEVANGALYYLAGEWGNWTIKRLAPDGTAEALPFTTVSLNFAVSPDGRYIAWGTTGEKPDEPPVFFSDLWVAEIATGQITAHLTDFTSLDEGLRYLDPVRFSDDGSTLFYTRRPDGLGGGPWAFFGRYDNLFSTPTTGGAVRPIFDCAPLGLFLCLGDFYQVEGQVATLAYVNDQTHEVVVLNGQGETINTLAVEAEYAGYPILGPTGELVFYSVELAEDGGSAEQAALHRVAPPTAPAEVVVSDPNLLWPQRFLDGGHVVVSHDVIMEDGVLGLAVVDLMTGSLQPLSAWPDAWVVGVLPASGSCVNDSAFVLDVSVPDGTHIAPGASFTKTWRLRNSGTCTWDASYRFDFISGEQMNGPQSMALGETVLPGEEVDISIDLIAPQADGTYRGQWQLVASDGTPFGAKPYVEIVVP